MPAPRNTTMFAGGSPFATRARFTGWPFKSLYACFVNAFTAFAVGFEVARVGPSDDARGDRIDETIHSVRREPVEVRFRRGFEGRLVSELGERTIPQTIEDHEEDLPFIHFGRGKCGP